MEYKLQPPQFVDSRTPLVPISVAWMLFLAKVLFSHPCNANMLVFQSVCFSYC